jgi:transcriptional regulator with XRE-family HTH domain
MARPDLDSRVGTHNGSATDLHSGARNNTRTDTHGRPIKLRQMIGEHLRQLRSARSLSREDAAAHLDASPSKVSRVELGEVAVKEHDLHRLLELYGVEPAGERRAVLDLARRATSRQWWHEYSDVLPDWFCSYLALEPGARTIRTYEAHFIPGLLQTRAYAEAVIRLRYRHDAEIRRRLDVRMRRQQMLRHPAAPRLWAVVDEAALCQEIGSPDVMQEQIVHLARAQANPRIKIQIRRSGARWHAAAGTSFSILQLPTIGLVDVVYLEQLDSALYFSTADECDPYQAAINDLSIAAAQPDDTAPMLTKLLRRTTT